MKRYKYLLANGCSFVKGDELKNESEERFSKLLSNRFGCEEINFGTSGGSNGETFRTTFDWIRNNQKKCKDTLIIIGLTELFRMDWWSNITKQHIGHLHLSWFPSSHKLQYMEKINRKYFENILDTRELHNFFHYYIKFFLGEEKEIIKLNNNVLGLNGYAQKNDADIIFFNSIGDHLFCKDEIYFFSFNPKNNKPDRWKPKKGHPNKNEHLKLSNMLYAHINKNE